MRFTRRNVGTPAEPPEPPERRCAFGCGKVASSDIQIGDFKIQTCRAHVDQALDMYIATRKVPK